MQWISLGFDVALLPCERMTQPEHLGKHWARWWSVLHNKQQSASHQQGW